VCTSLVGALVSDPSLAALGTWEGTSWLTALVVVAAYLLVSEGDAGERATVTSEGRGAGRPG
jgi:hypothetical protein